MTQPLSQVLGNGCALDNVVAFRKGATFTYGQLRARAVAVSAAFKGARRVALICEDTFNFAVGLYGLLSANATIILPGNHRAAALDALRTEFDIIVDDARIEALSEVEGDVAPINFERLSLIFLTSGSTGTPKKIHKSLAMFDREIGIIDALWGHEAGKGRVFSMVSHQHLYGITFKLFWTLGTGRAFSAQMYPLWESLLEDLVPGAFIISSPAHLERLGGIDPVEPIRRPVRIVTAGAPLSLEGSVQTEMVFGCVPTEIFGSTETGAFATRQQIAGGEAWKLFPGVEMRVDRESRLALRTPVIGDRWLETSDKVEPVGEGFRSLGRVDRIAKINGKRISFVAVEAALKQTALVQEAVVTALKGKTLAAVVVLSDEGRAALTKVGKFRLGRRLRADLASVQDPAAVPRLWRFVEKLPINGMGKVRDADVAALFGDGT